MDKQKGIIEKGKEIFYRLKPKLVKKYQAGHFVTIEVNSGKFFVGKNSVEAIEKAKKEFPQKQFFMAQVGKMAGILK
jgi:uncharacterized protein YlzI (FlbEa/FlbD family)